MKLNETSISMTRNIAEYIQHIKGGEITANALAKVFHIHPSNIRGCVCLAQSMGIPICSSHKGYFYSTRAEDIIATVNHMQQRVDCQCKAISGLKATMEEVSK